MAYKKGMTRYMKKGSRYVAQKGGEFYKGGDNKMYRVSDKDKDDKGEDDDAINSKKSEVDVDDFEKALNEVEALAKGENTPTRKEELLQKAMESDLSEEERDELYKAMGGDVLYDVEEAGAVENIQKSFKDAPESFKKALDVSEFLADQHSALMTSLAQVGSTIEKLESRQHEFNLVFAKAIHQMGTMIKSLNEEIQSFGNLPIRQPKSRGLPASGRAVQKSFGGNEGQGGGAGDGGEQLSKSATLDLMEEMMEKAGPDHPLTNQIIHETAKLEQTGQLSKFMIAQIQKYRSENAH